MTKEEVRAYNRKWYAKMKAKKAIAKTELGPRTHEAIIYLKQAERLIYKRIRAEPKSVVSRVEMHVILALQALTATG